MENLKERFEKEKFENENYYFVMVDGNNNPAINKSIATPASETITLKKCQELVKKIETHFNQKINELRITMTKFDYNISLRDYELSLYGDFGLKILGKEKVAIYNKKLNRLTIWEDNYPIYRNSDGVICNDIDALCDCLL